MSNIFLAVLMSLTTVVFAKDLVLDDFNNGSEKNSLGFFWYYYSDCNDSGNSVIHNALPKPGGGFTRIICTERENPANLCASLDYTLGDTLPLYNQICNSHSCDYTPFVGIGTDLCASGFEIDMNSIDSISFSVYSS